MELRPTIDPRRVELYATKHNNVPLRYIRVTEASGMQQRHMAIPRRFAMHGLRPFPPELLNDVPTRDCRQCLARLRFAVIAHRRRDKC